MGKKKDLEIGVSVVITTVERPDELRNAIESVLKQNYSPIEIIVVIDGGSQKSNKVVKEFKDNIKIVNNIPSVGGAESRNIGINYCSYDIIALLDDDDIWLENKLTLQVKCMENSNHKNVVSFTSLYTYTLSPKKMYVLPRENYNSGDSIGEFLFRIKHGKWNGWIQTSTLMGTKEAFKNNPFNPDLPKHQDWDWIINAEKLKYEIIHFNKPLTIYNKNISTSVSKKILWKFSERWIDEHRRSLSPNAYRDFFLAVVNNGISKDTTVSKIKRIKLIYMNDRRKKIYKTSFLTVIRFHLQYAYNMIRGIL